MDGHGTDAAQPRAWSLLLPKSEYKARPKDRGAEEAAARRWAEEDRHGTAEAARRGGPEFLLQDGPPYANGPLHAGHALNRLLKDTLLRCRRARGFSAPFVPGWDCHGLPVEWAVEKTLRAEGVLDPKADPAAFRTRCREWAAEWMEKQAETMKRLGVLADWEGAWSTMSPRSDAATVRRLHSFLAAGRLKRADRPVRWSVPEGTALAEAEVEHEDAEHPSLLVRFPLVDGEGGSLLCWTTTPWTLAGNRAVAFSPSDRHLAARVRKTAPGSLLSEGETLVLGEKRAEWALRTAGAEDWEAVASFGPGEMAGRRCRHPLAELGFGPEVPVLPGSFVEAGEGTGFVHAAPALGPEDHAFGLEHGLDAREVLRADGTLAEDLPAFGGLAVLTAAGRKGSAEGEVLAAARRLGASAWVGTGRHREARSWRSKAPLLWRCSPQWFLDAPAAAADLHARVEELSFVPEAGRRRLAAVVEGRPDWCLSRQRLWGVPLGLFVDADGGVLMDAAVSAKVAEAFAKDGGDAWWARPKEWFLAGREDSDRWEKCMDVLDVWFEAGCSPAWAGAGPGTTADLVLEGSDQHRGWFQACLSAGALEPRPPFSQVATHGFVEDALGRKMSKSNGNGADPEALAQEWGADALRVWAVESDWRGDPKLSEGALRSAAGFVADARNSLRFLLGCLEARWPAQEDLPGGSVFLAGAGGHERRLLAALAGLEDELRSRSDGLDTVGCAQALRAFLSKDLSAGWVEARKDALYCDDPRSPRAKAARGTCLSVCLRLCALLSPFTPFAAAEAEEFLRAAWRSGGAVLPDGPAETWMWAEEARAEALGDVAKSDAALEELRRLAGGAVESARAAKKVGASGTVRLDAKLPPDLAAALDPLEAAEACGCAFVSVSASSFGDGSECLARPAEGTACPRCRKIREPAGNSFGLCGRCAEAEESAVGTTPCPPFGEDLAERNEYRKWKEENRSGKTWANKGED